MEKTKLLWVGDYSTTGFGTVSRGFLRGLHETGEYDILQMGINWYDIDANPEPWRLVPAGWAQLVNEERLFSQDPYGYTRIEYFVKQFDPDIILINNDYLVSSRYMVDKDGEPTKVYKHRSLKVLYSPVDSDPAPEMYADIAKMFDLNIAYTDFQRQLMTERDELFALMPILYHGYDEKVYHPMDKTEAKKALVDIMVKKNGGEDRDKFEERLIDRYMVYFVGTNQFRKDLPCLFRGFKLFNDDFPDAILLPHTNAISNEEGWNLGNLQTLTEVNIDNTMLMKEANIYTDEEMNVFFNAADVLAYPTRGEGFGLPSLEAMAVKTPVIATAFGPQIELHSRGRGYFIDIRDVIPGHDALRYFVLPDHRSLYAQLKFVKENPEHVAETVETAYEFARQFTWADQTKHLHEILSKLMMWGKERDANLVQKSQNNKASTDNPNT